MPHVAGTRVNVSVVALYKYVYRVKSIMLMVFCFTVARTESVKTSGNVRITTFVLNM